MNRSATVMMLSKCIAILEGHDGKYAYLPKEGLLLPELLRSNCKRTSDSVPYVSCAEWVASDDHSLLINDCMASVLGSYIYKLLHRHIPDFS